MSDTNPSFIGGNIDHIEQMHELEAVIPAITASIRGDLSSLPLRPDDGEEVTEAALTGGPAQSLPGVNVYENIPFAGGEGDYSILSVLFGAHSIGEGIFGYLTMIDSNKIRVQCVECRKAIMDFPWMDAESLVKGSLRVWRAAFPVARAVSVSERRCGEEINDGDFVHIRGDARVRLHTVKIFNCSQITDAAFVYLHGIHTLHMHCCYNITDDAFAHLRGIHTLEMSLCHQITGATFMHLHGIHTLQIIGTFLMPTIMDSTFVQSSSTPTLYHWSPLFFSNKPQAC